MRPLTVAIRLGVYLFFYFVAVLIAGPVFGWIGGYLLGITATGLLAAMVANVLSLGIFEALHLPDIGLRWNAAATRNVLLGIAGGAGAAVAVLGPPVAVGTAHFTRIQNPDATAGTLVVTFFVLLCGASGEELLFRGYAFQILLRSLGPFATVLPVGVLFAALHAFNPAASTLGLVNTAGFGILFGYAFLRSHDLWLPIGLHYGWNVTLPLFGVNVSGLKIGVTGYTLEWTAGTLWSGGEYGPEASVLTSAVIVILFFGLWKAPICKQQSPLLDPEGEAPCAPGPQP
jgi:uncharacterized protein